MFNKHSADSSNPITIASASAFFRFLGDKEYSPAGISVTDILPVTIQPRHSVSLKFKVNVPHDMAFMIYHRPLRLKLVLTDFEDEQCSLVFEHICWPFFMEKAHSNDLGFFFDDYVGCARRVRIRSATDKNGVVEIVGSMNIGLTTIKVKALQEIVYKALKTGETEVELFAFDGGGSKQSALALIDLSCRRVYAFKILLNEEKLGQRPRFGCLGYVVCPEYGVVNETRPIQYAAERVQLPDFEPYAADDVVSDDTIDDIIPEPPEPAVPLSVISQVLSNDLNQRLASIDKNLSRLPSIDTNLLRIATALEQIAGASAKQ